MLLCDTALPVSTTFVMSAIKDGRLLRPDSMRIERLEWPRRLAVWAFVAVGCVYFHWRLGTINPDAPVFSWLIYGAEIFGFVTALVHVFMCWRLSVRSAPAPRPGLLVDVFVPTYNESVDLVRKTLLTAQAMDYPHKLWLLDDGDRAEMRALAAQVGCGYIARQDNTDAKAGNLNHALALTSGELIAVFDADHAPHRQFLSKTLGYFDDAEVAFVQTPQDFFNLDSFQHRKRRGEKVIWTEQSLFFRVIQRGKDVWNAAFYCGSCAVVRRSSLERIGGFAVGTVTEDLHTSIRLHSQGFKSVYHAEPLAFGVAPESVKPFISQRVRWGQGAMHVWRKEGILTNRGMSWAQRLCYLASVATYFDGWQKGVFYIAPVLVLTTATLPLITGIEEFLWHFVPYYLLTFLVFEEVGRGYGRSLIIEQYNMSRFAAFAWSTLALVFPTERFRVTPKGRMGEAVTRFTIPQWIVMVANLGAMPLSLLLYGWGKALPLHALTANLVWATVNAGLAAAVLHFTLRVGRNRRGTYRFPIPLAATLAFDRGETVIGTIDDISDNGFRCYANFPASARVGDRYQAHVTLPDGELRFSGEVRGLIPGERPADPGKGIGGTIQLAAEGRNRLERFLYGSELQWQLNGFSDRVRTPLSVTLPRWFAAENALRGRLAPRYWNAARLVPAKSSAGEAHTVIVSLPGTEGERVVCSFRPLPADALWRLDVYSRATNPTVITGLRLLERVETAGGALHFYKPVGLQTLPHDLLDAGDAPVVPVEQQRALA